MDVRKFARLALAAPALAAMVFACGGGSGGGSRSAAPMLGEKDKQYVRETLAGMKDGVRLVLFSRDGGDCVYCADAESLLADIAAAEPRVRVETLSLTKDAARARELGIDKVPGIAILGARDYGLRYFGLPSGFEFIPFVETLRSVGNDDPELLPETVAALGRLEKPVHLAVFVTQH
jgi:ABC-type glycerol-3-phosphate transport system substrate-binding protein